HAAASACQDRAEVAAHSTGADDRYVHARGIVHHPPAKTLPRNSRNRSRGPSHPRRRWHAVARAQVEAYSGAHSGGSREMQRTTCELSGGNDRMATAAGEIGSPTPLLTADQVLTTTRTVRKRLELGRPVPMELVNECLRIAQQAPIASN